ncbi:MAG: hypothetical protein M1814_006851 [Vezdaea aestivalis]|nr:MAG: hypothetical protein M1814_006851 [Vezdaea aestivalis]
MPSAVRQKRKKRPKKPENEELLDRLRRLEGMVEGIGKERSSVGSGHDNFATEPAPVDIASDSSPSLSRNSTEPQFGRLVIDEGKSRYVNDTFWSALNDEVNGIKTLIDDSTEDERKSTKTTPDNSADEGHHEFMFSYSSTVINMRAFHPKESYQKILWDAYKTNVEPLVKLVHLPTFEPEFRRALQDLDHVSKPMEAMVFAIYFSAVTSMAEEDCRHQLGDVKQKLLEKYKFALEQALSRAGFLSTQSYTTLSAFVLFLIASRYQCTTRLTWSLTGVAVRLAISLGLHRDGTLFNISPFDTEMRRRLWWHVVILDNRVSEDQGSDPTITEESFDTKFALNVNDTDIWPGMDTPPTERSGGTDMTFPIVRQEITRTYRRLTYVPPSSNTGNGGQAPLETKVKWIEETSARLESKYLTHMNMSLALNWATATIARLIMAKLWLIVHHPFQQHAQPLPRVTRDRLFDVSIDVIEYSTLLKTDKETKKWAWMHRTYVQWHAVAFLLKELCDRPSSPSSERGWAAVDAMWNEWGPQAEKRSGLWKLLRSLLIKALAARPPGPHPHNPLRARFDPAAAKIHAGIVGAATTTVEPRSFQPSLAFSPMSAFILGGDARTEAGVGESATAFAAEAAEGNRAHFQFGVDGPDVPLDLEDLDWTALNGVDEGGAVGDFGVMPVQHGLVEGGEMGMDGVAGVGGLQGNVGGPAGSMGVGNWW